MASVESAAFEESETLAVSLLAGSGVGGVARIEGWLRAGCAAGWEEEDSSRLALTVDGNPLRRCATIRLQGSEIRRTAISISHSSSAVVSSLIPSNVVPLLPPATP